MSAQGSNRDPSETVRLDEPLLTVEQAAGLLSVRPSWVYEAVRTEQLPVLRVGRHLRFTRAMLESWLQGQLNAYSLRTPNSDERGAR